MINYKSILAGEVRRRKYFRRMSKKYLIQCRNYEKELSDLRSEMFYLRIENKRLNGDLTSEIERRVKEGIAAERFAIEYDYCQKIDALEARLAIYETQDLSVSNDFDYNANAPMVLSAEQCKRLEEHLKKMRSISNKYKEVCRLMKSIDAVINE